MVAANVVDHIVPHKGDLHLFWNQGNWQSLCTTHHNAAKQAHEKSGIERGCDERGNPIDAAHHWQAATMKREGAV